MSATTHNADLLRHLFSFCHHCVIDSMDQAPDSTSQVSWKARTRKQSGQYFRSHALRYANVSHSDILLSTTIHKANVEGSRAFQHVISDLFGDFEAYREDEQKRKEAFCIQVKMICLVLTNAGYFTNIMAVNEINHIAPTMTPIRVIRWKKSRLTFRLIKTAD